MLALLALALFPSTTYHLVPDASSLVVEVDAAGFVSPLGVLHDHRFVVEDFVGEVVLADDASLESASFMARADSLRETANLSASDRRTVERQVRKDVLDADDHPRIVFVGTDLSLDDASPEGELSGTLTGELTIHGETQEVEVPFEGTLDASAGVLEASGSFTIRQTDFGIEPYSRYFGAVAVEDEVTIRIDLTASAR